MSNEHETMPEAYYKVIQEAKALEARNKIEERKSAYNMHSTGYTTKEYELDAIIKQDIYPKIYPPA